MFDYNLSTEYDPALFAEVAKTLDSLLTMKKEAVLRDVDDTLVQRYSDGENSVVLRADTEVGATYVKSDIDLSHIFK